MSYREYEKKLLSCDEAAGLVKSGDWVDFCQVGAFPKGMDEALARRKDELTDIKIRNAITLSPVACLEADPKNDVFTYNLWHCSGIDRKYIDGGRAFFSPMLFRDCGTYYDRGFAPVDVAIINVTPMDEDGYFNFGVNNCCSREVLEAAKTIIVEVVEDMPRVNDIFSEKLFVQADEEEEAEAEDLKSQEFEDILKLSILNDRIHISCVDAVVEGGKKFQTLPMAGAGQIDKEIAKQIFPYFYDGITLQLGIGGLPNALGSLIAESDIKDVGMHTELVSDGYMELFKAGKLTNRCKEIDRCKGVFAIAAGSRELYDFLQDEKSIVSAPISYVNNPEIISAFDNFVSINGCIAADLYGQVSSESVGTRHISGTGGQLDFVTGAYNSLKGKSFLAMPSTRQDKEGRKHSNILPYFSSGDIITTPRTQTQHIVTEYGVAFLPGKATWQRAERIIAIAHPDFRDELIATAEKQGIWRKSNKR